MKDIFTTCRLSSPSVLRRPCIRKEEEEEEVSREKSAKFRNCLDHLELLLRDRLLRHHWPGKRQSDSKRKLA